MWKTTLSVAAAALALGVAGATPSTVASAHEPESAAPSGHAPMAGHGRTTEHRRAMEHGQMMQRGGTMGHGQAMERGAGPAKRRAGRLGGHFRVIDQNEDGIVAADKAAARVERRFYFLDADDDGVPSEDEFIYAPRRRDAGLLAADPRWQRRHKLRHERFAEMDGDGDGRVSQAEIMDYGARRFATADRDGDGTVTVWEFRSLRRF